MTRTKRVVLGADRDLHLGLRNHVYSTVKGWEPPKPDGDEYDNRSILFNCYRGPQLVAVCRATSNTCGPLPIEVHGYDIPWSDVVEIGRIAVAPGENMAVVVPMLRAVASYLQSLSVQRAVYLARPGMARVLTNSGIVSHRVGPVKDINGRRAPYIVMVDSVEPLELMK